MIRRPVHALGSVAVERARRYDHAMHFHPIARALAAIPFIACTDSASTTPGPSGIDSGAVTDHDAAVAGDGASSVDSGPPPIDAGPADVTPPPPCPIGIDETITASVAITVDDYRKVYVNGALIADINHQWTTPTAHEVKLFRHPSKKNVIAVEGRNASSITGLDRGILVDVTWPAPDDAGLRHVRSDSTWRVSDTLAVGWFDVAFADAAFVGAVEEGKNGVAPWGNVAIVDPDAKWIWTYDSNKDVSLKKNDETVYARKELYLDKTGDVATTPGACP
jgi:hypothetical protein